MTTSPPSDVHRAIDAVWRIESARLIAGLTRRLDISPHTNGHVR